MDPLSIACGVASLVGAVTSISVFLFDLSQDLKGAEAKIVDLSNEVSRLASLLTSVERTIRQCQTVSLTLAHLDDHMWLQIETALVDCKCAVEELDLLAIKIRREHDTEPKALGRLLKSPGLLFRFTIYGDELSDLTKKIYKCNCAMQTALAVVNVSLTFRTHVSQESLFVELQKLKKLVQEAFNAATHHQAEVNPDPSSVRQSRNLENLAKAAQRFHAAASSTASTRYSVQGDRRSVLNWGGSETGSLTQAQRERIEVWNDDLSTVEESPEDGSKDGTLSVPTDPSTTITTPDLDDLLSDPGKGKGVDGAADEEADSDDGSDVEMDFLRNFEELAHSSFVAQDYSKAEQCLRMAVERSTGDMSSTANFRLLKIKLALCCCLQDKWDHAAGIVDSLPKTRSVADVPTFHLLQAISLAHLQGERFEDAYTVCKTALQGKKRVLGKTSPDYYGCLTILAAICDKKGDALEAEVVRHSIPRDWFPPSSVAVLSPKHYILGHETLIDSIFTSKKAGIVPTWSHPGSPISPDPSEAERADPWGQWVTLAPSTRSDSTQRAEKNEGRGSVVKKPDTGKDFLNSVADVPKVRVPAGASLPHRVLPPTNPWARHLTQEPTGATSQSTLNHFYDSRHQDQITLSPAEGQQHAASDATSPPPAPIYPFSSPARVSLQDLPPSSPFGIAQIPLRAGAPGTANTLTPLQPVSSHPPLTPSTRHRAQVAARATSLRQPRPADIWGLMASESQQISNQPIYQPSPSIQIHPPADTRQPGSGPSSQPRPSASSNLGRSRSHADRLERVPSMASRPLGHQTLIDNVELAKTRRAQGHRPSPSVARVDTARRPPSPPREVFIEEIAAGSNEEYFSTLEVVTPGGSSMSPGASFDGTSMASPTSPTVRKLGVLSGYSPLSSPGQPPRTRWIVQKDISNIGEARPFGYSGQPQFLPTRAAAVDADSLSLGVALRFDTSDAFSFSRGRDDATVCELSWAQQAQDTDSTPGSSSSGMLGMRKLIRRMKSNIGRDKGTGESQNLAFTVGVSSPRLWSRDPVDISPPASLLPTSYIVSDGCLRATLRATLRLMEITIAEQIQQAQQVGAVRVGSVVCTLPEFLLDPLAWPGASGSLADCSLFQHSKIIPHSFAVMQYFLDTGELCLPPSDPNNPVWHNVLVLNCDDWIVECSSYVLQGVSPEFVEVMESDSSYMAEVASLMHVQSAFSQLIHQKVKQMNDQFKQKMDQAATDAIVKSCVRQFHEKILPGFDNDGRSWIMDYEMPRDFAAFRHGRFELENVKILACFSPSLSMMQKMILCSVDRTREMGDLSTWHLLVAGPYSKSQFLRAELQKTMLEKSRMHNLQPPTLLYSTEAENILTLGALSHARGC
ncbi:hypothetical protein QBC39DRAFT_361660 [Podospora conica]|nr:hypothetical protein QBC39DRAFT_361660 [Schizothecium conicum]